MTAEQKGICRGLHKKAHTPARFASRFCKSALALRSHEEFSVLECDITSYLPIALFTQLFQSHHSSHKDRA